MSAVDRIGAACLLCLAVLLQSCAWDEALHAESVPRQPPPAQPQTPSAQPAAAVDPLDANVYQLAAGDVVRIDVLGESELSLEASIDPSGYINYPFLGRVRATGLTVRALEEQIRTGLAGGYLINPDVRVSLAQHRPVFVSGQVVRAGAYPYTLGLTVEQALTLAGGISGFGSANRIFLQKWGAGRNERVRVSTDSRVLPGDTIIVEERLF